MTQPAPPVQRLRLRYGKKGDARYIGHLDVARFWERVFRRVELPLAYSHGFNPQPRMQFASALPVGIEAENELLDVWLLQAVEPASWIERLRRTLPTGFILHGLDQVSLDLPAMQASLRAAQYRIEFGETGDIDLARRVRALLDRERLLRPHHKKPNQTYDLRPLIHAIEVLPGGETSGPHLLMNLAAGQEGNARVTEVIEALDLASIPHHIVRTGLSLAEPEPA